MRTNGNRATNVPDQDGMPRAQPSLMQRYLLLVIRTRMVETGTTQRDVASLGVEGFGESGVSRFLSGQLRAPQEGIDLAVEVFADAMNCAPMDLWEAALERWREDPDGRTLEIRERQLQENIKAAKQLAHERGRRRHIEQSLAQDWDDYRFVNIQPLREAFEQSNVSASEVARHLGWTYGPSREPNIRRVRRTLGRDRLPLALAARVCEVLGVDPDVLGPAVDLSGVLEGGEASLEGEA